MGSSLLSFSPHRICVSLKYAALSFKFIRNSMAGFLFSSCVPPPLPPLTPTPISPLGVQCCSHGECLSTSGRGRIRLKMEWLKVIPPPHPPTPLCKRMGLGWNLLWWWFSWFSGVVFVEKKDPPKEKKLRQYLHLDESFII